MNKKVLVFGAGYLGSRIGEYLHAEIVSTDITDAEAVRAILEEKKPEVVINTAAKTLTGHLEKAENQHIAHKVNVDGALNIARACEVYGAQMIHLSTAMMFDGPGITEESQPNPLNFYAATKAEADKLLQPYSALILRIHTPLSNRSHPRNLLTKLVGFDKGVTEPSSLTVVEDFLQALEALIEQGVTGIFNVVNPGSISIFQIIELMKEGGLVPLEKQIGQLSEAEITDMITASGGALQTYPILSTEKLEGLGISLRPVEEAVIASIKTYQ